MSYQESTEKGAKPPHAFANTQDVQSIRISETSSGTSSSVEETDNSTATSAQSLPALCKTHIRRTSQDHYLSPAPTVDLNQEDTISCAGTTLIGHSQTDFESTLYEDKSTPFQDPSPKPHTQAQIDLAPIDPASFPLPIDPSEPEPTSFHGIGLVSSSSRPDAFARSTRKIGRCAVRRLGMRILAKARRDLKDAVEEDRKEEREKDGAERVVGDGKWETKEEEMRKAKYFGIIRPVGIAK